MLTARDIMTTDVVTIAPEMDLHHLAEALVRYRVSGAPVVANGQVLGVVSATDLLEFMQGKPATAATTPDGGEGLTPPSAYYIEWWSRGGADVGARLPAFGAPEWNRLGTHTAADVMTRSLCAVRADATITSAADYLLRADVHRVLVLDGRRFVGILTTTDVVRAVAQGRLREVPAQPETMRSRATASRR